VASPVDAVTHYVIWDIWQDTREGEEREAKVFSAGAVPSAGRNLHTGLLRRMCEGCAGNGLGVFGARMVRPCQKPTRQVEPHDSPVV